MAFTVPTFTQSYQPRQKSQYQAVANNQTRNNPMAAPTGAAGTGQTPNPLGPTAAMAPLVNGAKRAMENYNRIDGINADLTRNGFNPMTSGQQIGATLGLNDYAKSGGAGAVMRDQQGIPSDVQGPAMSADMFKQAGGVLGSPAPNPLTTPKPITAPGMGQVANATAPAAAANPMGDASVLSGLGSFMGGNMPDLSRFFSGFSFF